MSGFVVGYGQPEQQDIEKMFEKIAHRGPDFSGVWEADKVIMAQNYLQADLAPGGSYAAIPVSGSEQKGVRVCFDGQIGDLDKLARDHGMSDEAVSAEKVLLHLYDRYGADMFEHLGDAILTCVISDGHELLAARDLLGIKTLFYGTKDETLYLASELKSLVAITADVSEFPPGHTMDGAGEFSPFARLPQSAPEVLAKDVDEVVDDVRTLIQESFDDHVDFGRPTAALLSGGMDSSVITCMAHSRYQDKFGAEARLPTFSIGVGESGDIHSARTVAAQFNTDHHELIVSLEEVLAALPDVIYHLESFDPSLVRSSVSNYLVSGYAAQQGVEVLLSGEGGDEIFCGYMHMREVPPEELAMHQVECLDFLHNNASLRLDRMNQSHSIRVVAPLISDKLLDYALTLPPEYKVKPDEESGQKVEKWIFRKAFEKELPESITQRTKQEFSQGSGSAALLPGYFERGIDDGELETAQAQYPMIRSKEELYYFRIFTDHFGAGPAADTVGQWLAL